MPDEGSIQIAASLDAFLQNGGIRNVYLAGGATSPPQLAYMVHFPRLSVILSGKDQMEIEQNGAATQLPINRGDAIFVPPNCWNKPAWAGRVRVLTVLFGKRQTGLSLVSQASANQPPVTFKTHFHRPMEGPAPGILQALTTLASTEYSSPTDRLLVEALLHACLKLLREPATGHGGKADKTFQSLCLYLQENFQFPLTRDSVADHFRLSPNHVSRIFRNEGLMKFTDDLTSVRLDRAKYLLRNHDRTLAEVANSCGFSDIHYFCRVFKRRTKVTPTAYRMQRPADIAAPPGDSSV